MRETVNIATSATIVDSRDPDAGRRFASRFFGTPADQVVCVHEEYEAELWKQQRNLPKRPSVDLAELLKRTLAAVDSTIAETEVQAVHYQLTGWPLGDGPWQKALAMSLEQNELAYQIRQVIHHPQQLDTIVQELQKQVGREVSEEELLCYLALGSAATSDGRPVFRPVVHAFIRGIPGAVVSFPVGQEEPALWLSSEDES